jgi:hypothetical protein
MSEKLSMCKWLLLLFFILITSSLFADVKSSSGNLRFDSNSDGTEEMILNSIGLGVGKSSPVSSLDINGTFGLSYSFVTSDANLENLNSLIIVGSSVNNVKLTLPSPSEVSGRFYTIKHNNSTVRSTLTSSSNIDGESYLAINPISNSRITPSVTVMSDGTTWNVLNAHRQDALNVVAADDLVVWWTFDDEPTTTFQDHSLQGNDGVIGGSADYEQIDGVAGRAIKAISRQDLLSVSNNTTLNLEQVSAGFWIKGADADEASWGNYANILAKMDINQNGWQIDLNSNGSIPRMIRSRTDVSVDDRNNVTTNIDIFDDTWHHIVYTMADDTASFYIDGVLSSTRTLLTGAGNTLTNSEDLEFTPDVNMSIDEVRIYNRELSADEVSKWYVE